MTDVGRSTVTKKKYKTRVSGGKAGGRVTDLQQQIEWYIQPDDRQWEYTTALCRALKNKQVRRRYELAVYQNLYCNTGSFWAGSLFRSGSSSTIAPYHRLNCNVIKSCVDTSQARIAKDKVRVFILPSSADSRLILKADKCTKFLDGSFDGGGVYAANDEVFRDGGIYGDGAVLFKESRGQIAAEYLKIDEVVIDEIVGMYNDPYEIHWQHPTPLAELLAEYPDQEEKIREAKNSWKGEMAFMSSADMVLVTHSWRRTLTDKGGDADVGRHVVAIEGCTLLSEEWTKPYLPIVRWQYSPPTYGPFGFGIAQEIEGMQRAINEVLRSVMQSIYLFAVPRVWIEKLSQVSQHQIQNGISVNQYTGTKPVFETPPAASGDVYQFLQWMIDWCYKQLGLSQLSSQSDKPAGLNSGVAMRTYQDVETQRFAIVGQRWERFHIEEAKIILDMSADLYKKNKKLSVKVPGRSFIETVNWKDASLDEDQYSLQAFPTSLLPRTPEGQLNTIQELIQSGFMPIDVALSQIKIPNLNAWIDEMTASRDNIMLCLSRIRDQGKYVSPNGIADVDKCVAMAANAWLRADLDPNIPIERTELLLRFFQESLAMQASKNAPPPAPPSAGPPGAPPPGGPPGPPPQGPVVGAPPPPPQAPLAPAGTGPIQAAA
jgi:hypothetical protein